MRLAPLSNLVGNLVDFSASVDYTTTGGGTSGYDGIAPGTVVSVSPTQGIDTTSNVPNWIASEVMWVVNTSSSTFTPGSLVHIDKNCAISAVPSTANTGRPVYVTVSSFTAGDVTTQGGWVMRKGIAPIKTSVAATAGAVFIGTAGVVTPTAAAGKQLLGMTCLGAAASTWTRTVTVKANSAIAQMSNVQGLFPGLLISGTGIPGGASISSVNPDGQSVTLSANATASGTVTATFTPTGFGIYHFEGPFVQGQIT